MSTIEQILSAARARLAELDSEAEHLRALVRLYGGASSSRVDKPDAGPHKARLRGPSSAWKPLGLFLAKRHEAHLDELAAFSAENALGFDRTQIRNQMHNWKRRGFVDSPRQSVFVITRAGMSAIGVAGNSNGTSHEPAPLPSLESADEPQSSERARFDLLNPNKAAVPGGGI
jgi:hypothetical protein